MAVNKNGLGRDIPSAVKRQVRQRCGFGCVVCGSAFYQYDHLGIEFKDAVEHDPDQLVLLCGGCHDRKTRGALSTATLQRHAKNPRCKQDEFSWGPIDIGEQHPEVVLGNVRAIRVGSLLTIDGEDVFSVVRSREPGSPFSVYASLYDKEGRQTLKIVNNEFQTATSNWDAELVGSRISIRSNHGEFDVVMRFEPPSAIVIERLDMAYRDVVIRCREGENTTIERGGAVFSTIGLELIGSQVAILLNGVNMHIGHGGGFRLTGGAIKAGAEGAISFGGFAPFGPAILRQGRNELCQCGSGVRFKRCHGILS
jgi:hypothetical protein